MADISNIADISESAIALILPKELPAILFGIGSPVGDEEIKVSVDIVITGRYGKRRLGQCYSSSAGDIRKRAVAVIAKDLQIGRAFLHADEIGQAIPIDIKKYGAVVD